MKTTQMITTIGKFLAEPRRSDGGYAEVTEQDVATLSELLDELLAAKFEPDPDGDMPIRVRITDLTRYQPLRYLAVPRTRPTDTWKEIERRIHGCMCNMAIANEETQQAVAPLYRLADDSPERAQRLEEACRQARACLMNLQPDEPSPMRQQMQKMIHELTVALGECD
jgi:hypothetical protein